MQKAIECRTKPSALSWQGMNDWTEIKEIGYWDNIESSQNQSTVHLRMQKSAGMKCTSRLGGLIGTIEYSFITDVNDSINYSDAIKEYTFADGTPFGIREE